jgi:ABC-type transport system substrate-binding protein
VDVSSDGKTITFKLRKGVKFHDGTDFNAQAAKFNLELMINSTRPVLKTIKSVDIVDDYTIRVNLSTYDALILYEMAQTAFMASPTAIEKNGKKWAETHAVGTGAFKLKKYERDVRVVLERNDEYWRKDRPYLDGLEMKVVKNPMTQIAALKTDEIQGIISINQGHAQMMEKEGYVLSQSYGPGVGLHGDSKNPDSVWANRKVREAIEYAIDKETMLKELGYNYPDVLYQLVTTDSPFYNPDLKPRKYNPEKAKKLLAEAGYPNGFKTSITYLNQHWPASWPAIQADLAKVGIDVKLIPVDRPKYLKIRFEGALKNGASHVLWRGQENALEALKNAFLSTARHIPDTARPAGYDDIVNKAFTEPDPEIQKALILDASKLLYDDVTFIPLYVAARLWAFDKKVKDYEIGKYTYDIGIFTNAWIDK